MDGRHLLRSSMNESGVSQSELSRLSGVRQPSISQFLSGRIEMSDDQLDRLLNCLGLRLEVERRSVRPDLTRSELRSWHLHRRISRDLDDTSLSIWRPLMQRNLVRLGQSTTGEPHTRHLIRWRELVEHGDVNGLHRVLTGLDRSSVEMREVSPFGGVLTEDQRRTTLDRAS